MQRRRMYSSGIAGKAKLQNGQRYTVENEWNAKGAGT